ncbi:prenyltransferase/squalene oxidase repeat-containing protein [Pyrococcus kukulkanii]|uniref:Prenyltransferase alpha-alpha toroid domain-containing protein n=1 Tax=Pyrococcus kukulkanii TaxID=1609559 RepID=A0A127BDE6_9EURY|nr:prenyltransferase/squalene oxidase repeat-containing protein [Pyrococcus kukulkanii]AMM54829.1 hypothetical protein TQ32_10280 [Pyrococcus kukulkanii]
MRWIVPLILMIIILAPVSAVDMLDFSAKIARGYPDEGRIERLSIIVMALSQALNKTPSLPREDVWVKVERLISWQNEDGGWGYFYGSVSSVPDTAYALIGLKYAYEAFKNDPKRGEEIRVAIVRGVKYLEEAFTGNGWGYLPGMTPDYRSTLLASAALVLLGEDLYLVRKAYQIIKDKLPSDPYLLHLWIMVTYNMEGKIPEESIKYFGNQEGAIALKAYTLLSLKGLDFQTAILLAELEEYKHNWTDKYYPLYSTMAFSLVSENVVEPSEDKLKKVCTILEASQNEDGGWGVYVGSPSTASVTYFVLDSLRICNPMSEAVKRGLEYMRRVYERDMEEIKFDKYLRQSYLFALLSLLEYRNLTYSEKEEAKSLILSSFWGDRFGKQPLTTALAIKALTMLGIPKTDKIIEENLEWLMRMKKDGGWGFAFETDLLSWYFAPMYPETTVILDMIKDIVLPSEIQDVIEYVKDNPPKQAWELLSIYLTLNKLGINQSIEVEIQEPGKSPLYDSFLVKYYTVNPEVPRVNIYTVISKFRNSSVKIISTDPALSTIVAKGMESILSTNTSVRLTELVRVPEYGDYVLIYPVGRIDVSRYNSDVKIYIRAGHLTLNGVPLSGDGVLVIVPGRNRDGELLFVLYRGEGYKEIARLIFQSPILKYLHGKAVIASWVDTNKDGKVQVEELSVKFL